MRKTVKDRYNDCILILNYLLKGGNQSYKEISEATGISYKRVYRFLRPTLIDRCKIDDVLTMREKNPSAYYQRIVNSYPSGSSYFYNKSLFPFFRHVLESLGYSVIFIGKKGRIVDIRKIEEIAYPYENLENGIEIN